MEVRNSRTAHGRALEEIAPEGQQGERAMPSQSCNLMDATKGQSVESPRADKATRQPRDPEPAQQGVAAALVVRSYPKRHSSECRP